MLVVHRPADLYRAADTSYIKATHRASAYLTGVALGYLLQRVPRKIHIPKVRVRLLRKEWIQNRARAKPDTMGEISHGLFLKLQEQVILSLFFSHFTLHFEIDLKMTF